MSKQPLPSEVFTDVRKAYRLLHDYQRMTMDALEFMGKQLAMDYGGGHQKFSGRPPRNGSGTLNRWAWDWLGMYFYELHFTKQIPRAEHDTPAFLRLSALHAPDTAGLAIEEADRPNTSDYLPAGDSSSKICFFYSLEETGQGTWKSWDVGFINNLEERVALFKDGTLPAKYLNKGMGVHLIDVADICSEQQALRVVSDLQQKLNALHPIIRESECMKSATE